MLKKVNYYSLNYHMKESGVTTVIEEIFTSIFNKKTKKFNLNLFYSSKKNIYKNSKINIIDIPQLDYSDKIYTSFENLKKDAIKIKNSIIKNLDLKSKCILHTHNVNLFKNSALGYAIQLLSNELKNNKDFIILMQVHDFAEDNRNDRLKLMQTCTGKTNKKIATSLAYPINNNIHYLTINSRDKKILEKINIPSNKISIFPNCIQTEIFTKKASKIKTLKNNLEKYAKENNYLFSRKRKIITSPIKIIKRKNVIESLLVLNLLNSIKDEWQLLITLEPNSKSDIEYCNLIKNHIRKYNLPVTIGFGKKILERSLEDAKKHNKNTVTDLLNISDLIITTSIQEGFGFTFLEGWLTETKVIGRRIDHIFKDFENNGINLNHFYKNIKINKKDFKDYSAKIQIDLLKKIDYKKLSKRKENKILFEFIKNKNKKTILNNKKQILKNYSIKNYKQNLLSIIEKASNNNIKKTLPRKIVLNNSKIIKYFKDNKN